MTDLNAALDRFERAAMAYERLGSAKRDDEKTRQMRKDGIAELAAAREALRARLSQAGAGGVVVKPLEWRTHAWGGEADGGRYRIEDNGTNWTDDRYWLFVNVGLLSNQRSKFATLDEAKAAAQANYEARIRSALAPSPSAVGAHTDDIAVDRFAVAMKAKLAKKRDEGRGGWEDKMACSNGYLSLILFEHLKKGDPVDIGNIAMMLHQRGEVVADDRERYYAKVQRDRDGTSEPHPLATPPAPVPTASAEAAALSPEERERRLNAAVEARKKQEPGPLPMWSPSPPATPVQPTASVEAGDKRPADCRFRLCDEGKPYPKSSCSACGKGIATGLGKQCSLTPAPTQGEAPVAWMFELARAIPKDPDATFEWGSPQLSFTRPNAGKYQRNVRPLVYAPAEKPAKQEDGDV